MELPKSNAGQSVSFHNQQVDDIHMHCDNDNPRGSMLVLQYFTLGHSVSRPSRSHANKFMNCCQRHLLDFQKTRALHVMMMSSKSVLPVCPMAESAFWSDSTVGICLAD